MARGSERALLEAVIEQMPIAVVIFDTTGDVAVSNREYERIFGARPASNALAEPLPAMSRHDGSVVADDDLPGARALRSRARVEEELVHERPDGQSLSLWVRADPVLDDAGGVVAVAVMIDDVTRREERERAEREFVTNAAHELQSPIAAVLAAAEALDAGAKDYPAERERFIRHIIDACNRLARLTSALLVLARAETGAEAAKRELVTLAPLLRSVAAAATVGEGVTLRLACPPDAAALAHPALLEQALANLVSNATKHTKSGSIALSTTIVNGSVEISVADTGSGIALADQERIRRRFVRLEETRDGFGLGLAISDQAVRAMGGELRIDSLPGRGTTATIVLPAATVIET